MGPNQKQFRWRIVSVMVALAVLTVSSLTGAFAQATLSCSATYSITSQWPGAFQGKVAIANNGTSAITGWTVTWTFANGQSITQLWGGILTQNGASETVRNETWNGSLAAGGAAESGFLANWSGTNNVPTNVVCTPNGGGTGPTNTPTRTPTTGPTRTPTRTPTTGPTSTPTRTPTPVPADVQIVDFAFQPASLTVNQGATVTWRNAGAATHTTTSDTNLWNSGNLTPGQTFAFTFTTAGTFTYHCNIHTTMTGTITVNGGATATPTRTPTTGPTSTPTRTPTPPPVGTHVPNPFAGATFYRNVDYVASVNAEATLRGGTLGAQMRQVANFPTFVWMDSIDAVNGTNGYPRSLAGHLDAALAQGATGIGLVIYDLPNRDCSALASNGELLIAQNGLNRYKTEYIDVIFNTIRQAKYSGLRIAMIIEPDSLPNLITNLSFAKCSEAQSTGAYVQGVQYAIGTLRSIPNTYAYIDVGHHGWLGWDTNFNPFVSMMKTVGAGIPGGIGKIDGFIGNTANTGPTVEPFMTANQMINGQPVRSLQGWYDFNVYIDEQSYLTGLRAALISGDGAFPAEIGMLIDTSRNGWGGPNRPTGPSTSTDLRTFVLATRIDKRIHKGNWCNQDGAGIGARPTAAPAAGFDAFVWVKPPGESDGSSSLVPTGPDNPGGKGFDRMCDPTYGGNSLNGNSMSGALPNAPVSGRWFPSQFAQLVQNAFPAFQ
jgi:cellulose 1,4-beta-cellobiosidase